MDETKPTDGPRTRVLAYLRCSTEELADSRAGIEAQRATISAEVQRRGWEVEYVEDAGYSAKDLVVLW